MTCEKLVTYLSGYIDRDLDKDLYTDAAQHLATCQNCRIVLEATQQMFFHTGSSVTIASRSNEEKNFTPGCRLLFKHTNR